MPREGLHPDVALSIRLGAIMSRNQYTRDPAPVIDELYTTAGDRLDILTTEVGLWVGFYSIPENQVLCDALRSLPLDTAAAIEEGSRRRRAGAYSTTGFNGPYGTGVGSNDSTVR